MNFFLNHFFVLYSLTGREGAVVYEHETLVQRTKVHLLNYCSQFSINFYKVYCNVVQVVNCIANCTALQVVNIVNVKYCFVKTKVLKIGYYVLAHIRQICFVKVWIIGFVKIKFPALPLQILLLCARFSKVQFQLLLLTVRYRRTSCPKDLAGF